MMLPVIFNHNIPLNSNLLGGALWKNNENLKKAILKKAKL